MMKLVRDVLVVAMLGVVSAGAFAQKKDQDKRPPKEPVKVIDRKDSKPPPPPNSNKPKPDNKKKPD